MHNNQPSRKRSVRKIASESQQLNSLVKCIKFKKRSFSSNYYYLYNAGQKRFQRGEPFLQNATSYDQLRQMIFSSGLDLNDIVIIAFQARKYLKLFGPNWNRITELIQMDPIFSAFPLTAELVNCIFAYISFYCRQEGDQQEYGRQQQDQFLGNGYFEVPKSYSFQNVGPARKEQIQQPDDQVFFDFGRYQEQISQPPEVYFSKAQQEEEEHYRQFASNVINRMRRERIVFPEKRSQLLFKGIQTALLKFKGPNSPQKPSECISIPSSIDKSSLLLIRSKKIEDISQPKKPNIRKKVIKDLGLIKLLTDIKNSRLWYK